MTIISFRKLLKATLGAKFSAYLHKQMLHALAIRPSYIKDMILYRFVRLKTSKQSYTKLSSRKKPHILILIEKWNSHNPEFGPSQLEHVICGTLEASGLATYDRLNFDEYHNQYSFDKEVLIKCQQNKPDLVFIGSWLLCPLKLKTMGLIRERLQIPIVIVWGDSVSHMEEMKSLLPFVDLSVVDMCEATVMGPTKPKMALLLGAHDPRIFHNPHLYRDIDVSFVGSMRDYPDRIAAVSALRASGIDVFQSGGQAENRLPIDEYARVLMRSKITLDFCRHTYGMLQIKPHIFEGAMCGAMVVEADNPLTPRFFEPMVDYVPFKDEKDLVEKVRHYLSHDSEREMIAANGHRKVNERYTAEIFWKMVLRKVLGTDF